MKRTVEERSDKIHNITLRNRLFKAIDAYRSLHFSRYFPRIFGESKDMPLDYEESLKQFQKLTNTVHLFPLSHV